MEPIKKVGPLLTATFVVWLCVAVVARIDSGEFAGTAAAILALIATMTIWTLWALDAYGIGTDDQPREKAKRDAGSSADDPRLALLLSLFTPDERDALRARLMDDLAAEGEAVSLADLLAEHERGDLHGGRSS